MHHYCVREGATPSWSYCRFCWHKNLHRPAMRGAGTAAVDGERSTCPRELVDKLKAARAKVRTNNLLTAMGQYFKPLAESLSCRSAPATFNCGF